MRWAVSLAVGAALVAVLTLAGVWEALGAHPWWSARVGWVGAGIGVAALVGLRALRARPAAVLAAGLVALAAAGLAAHYGKAAFVASYADNHLAGRFWFFGWFGATAALAVSAADAVWWLLARSSGALPRLRRA